MLFAVEERSFIQIIKVFKNDIVKTVKTYENNLGLNGWISLKVFNILEDKINFINIYYWADHIYIFVLTKGYILWKK